MRAVIGSMAAVVMAIAPAVAQSLVGPDQVQLMATAVQMAGHACEGMLGQYLGESDGSRIYIVECRGGDRFVYMDMPGGKVGVTPCAVMRAQGYAC